jgi:hypothetical protein
VEFAAKKTQNAPLGTLAERLRLDGLEISQVECPRLTSGKSIFIARLDSVVPCFSSVILSAMTWHGLSHGYYGRAVDAGAVHIV